MEDFAFVTMIGSLIIFVAFFLRSLTGFGSALISIPLLALLFDLKFVVPLEALFEVGLSVLLMSKVYNAINKTILAPLIVGTVVGSLLGTYVLYAFADVSLKRALGVIIILFALHLWLGKQSSRIKPPSSSWGVIAGTVGGILGGLFGTSGPAFVMYLTDRLEKKDVLRASLIGLFAIDYTWRVGVYATTGLLTTETLRFGLLLMPALVLGTILGHKVHLQISEGRFRQIVAGVLTVSGILLIR